MRAGATQWCAALLLLLVVDFATTEAASERERHRRPRRHRHGSRQRRHWKAQKNWDKYAPLNQRDKHELGNVSQAGMWMSDQPSTLAQVSCA